MAIRQDDPGAQYLVLDRNKAISLSQNYDGKKCGFIPHIEHGFLKVVIESVDGNISHVVTENKENLSINSDNIMPMNPPKYNMIEDMANMTHLNEACVFQTLYDRYVNEYIYTYSGLFCIVINPFKRFPIYTSSIVAAYKGRKRTEMPPHLFAVADNAYQNMLRDHENQSMLITGESGAGKTENTKKVISYFALIAALGQKPDDSSRGTLEDQIVQTNPVLEAFGNAKTVRNNNSSRFGKFIRIHFGPTGKIAGCDIETYLLEKSRVSYQLPGVERNYHIFYWLLSNRYPDYLEKLLLEPEPAKYRFINNGCLTAEGINDQEEMKNVNDAFRVLGFSEEEKFALYKSVAAVLHFGQIRFKQRGEQAECDATPEAEKAAYMIGINSKDLLKALLQPKVKVGSEYVTKGQNLQQVTAAVSALSKAIYCRIFGWIVAFLNKTLDTKKQRQYFIGVLDIAGFEIFELNTLEQLLINYTNERLQQFFNHHMFVKEQEEYSREGIEWDFIDFGMDLQACIDLIEKPMGILSILAEECLFPKATDQTLQNKLYENHMGKTIAFSKPKPKKNSKYDSHFEIGHYAGNVGYNITGWLDKNKDPLTETLIATMHSSKDTLIASLFVVPEESKGKGKKKGGSVQTISATHKEQLNKLMRQLQMTSPLFVRCIIPNEKKQPGLIDATLVMNQLKCNGVLEGIRICRKGFPNRLLYSEFKQRYSILCPNAVPRSGFVDSKIATGKIMESLPLEKDTYRLGDTKIFFRASILGKLEELRDERLSKIVMLFQAWIRSYMVRKGYKKLQDQRTALSVIQRNIRSWLCLRNWTWWRFYLRVKPLLSVARQEDEMRKAAEMFEKLKEDHEKLQKHTREVEAKSVELSTAKKDLQLELEIEHERIGDLDEHIEQLLTKKMELDEYIRDLESRVESEETNIDSLNSEKQKLQTELDNTMISLEDALNTIKKLEHDKKTKEKEIIKLETELSQKDKHFIRLQRDFKKMEKMEKETQSSFVEEQERLSESNKARQNIEKNLNNIENQLNKEKKFKSDLEKSKRRVDNELKQLQSAFEILEKDQRMLVDNFRGKEQDISMLNGKIEEEQSIINQQNKKIKNLMSKIEENEEDIENLKTIKNKVERQKVEITHELEELTDRYEEVGGVTQAQIDINKRREAEVSQLKKQLEDYQLNSEMQLTIMKKKNTEMVQQLNDEIDELSQSKIKIERSKADLTEKLAYVQYENSANLKSKNNLEKNVRVYENKINDLMGQLRECEESVVDLEGVKQKYTIEAIELNEKISMVKDHLEQYTRENKSIKRQLEESKQSLEEEIKCRNKTSMECRTLEDEISHIREQLEEENDKCSELNRHLSRVQQEANVWRQRAMGAEQAAASDNLGESRLQSKLVQKEQEVDEMKQKVLQAEKVKKRLQMELEDSILETERSTAGCNQIERKSKQQHRIIEELKNKITSLNVEVESEKKACKELTGESVKIKAQLVDLEETIEKIKRDERHKVDECENTNDLLKLSQRSLIENENVRKRLESEKDDLQNALEEAEVSLENQEIKISRLHDEIINLKAIHDAIIKDKDEEFDITRRNHQKAIESIHTSLEIECKSRNEALRVKRKLENEIGELEARLDSSDRQKSEFESQNKRLISELRDFQLNLENERHNLMESHNQIESFTKRELCFNINMEELNEEIKTLNRRNKSSDFEIKEMNERMIDLTNTNSSLNITKKKLENDLVSLQSELEEQKVELKEFEDTNKMLENERLNVQNDMSKLKESHNSLERTKLTLQGKLNQFQSKFDELETNKSISMKRATSKYDKKIQEIEFELDVERKKSNEHERGLRRSERRLREIILQIEDERRGQQELHETIEKLQNRIKILKHQLDDSEELASINLAKYRKVQQQLEEVEDKLESSEGNLIKIRARNRTTANFRPSSVARKYSNNFLTESNLTRNNSRASSPDYSQINKI